MSLINSVLRDLDKRRAGDEARKGLPDAVRPLPGADEGSPRGRLLAIVAAGAVAVAAVAMWPAPAPAPVPAPATPIGAAMPATVPAAPAPVPAAVPPASTPAVAPLPTASTPVASFQADVRRLDAPAEVVPPPAPTASVPPPAPEKPASKAESAKATVVAKAGDNPAKAPEAAKTVRSAEASIGQLRLDSRLLMPVTPRESLPAATRGPAVKADGDDDWARAQALLREGRNDQAEPLLRRLVAANAGNAAARQVLVGLLIGSRRHAEAADLLRQGLVASPEQTGWAMTLARLHAEANDYPGAWDALGRSAQHAQQNADYLAFCGTVLQRLGRSGEAVGWYRKALQLRPREGRWWVGLGIALEAEGKPGEARESYARSLSSEGMTREVMSYAEQRLAALH